MIRQLYIMGRGHSGTTILDAILGGSSSGVSTGELLSSFFAKNPVCSCGEKVDSCDHWKAIKREFNSNENGKWEVLKALSVKYGSIKMFPSILFSKKTKNDLKELARLTDELSKIILVQSEGLFLIDSSKEISRGFFYSRYLDTSKVIFLVKNGEQILASYWWRLNNGEEFKFLRKRYKPRYLYFPYMLVATLGWVIGNLIAELVMWRNESIMRVRYEDLVDDSCKTIDQISKFIDIPLDDIKLKINNDVSFPLVHIPAGNRIRMAGDVKLKKEASNRELPRRYKFMFKVLAWPLCVKYKY